MFTFESVIRFVLVVSMMGFGSLVLAATPSELKDFDDSTILPKELPDWFVDTSLAPNMQEYLEDAVAAGKKGLIVNYESDGCSYCKLFIDTTLQQADIVTTIQQNFDMLGLDMFSDSEIVDFNGKTASTKDFVKAEGVQYTPTVIFYGTDGKRVFKAGGYYDPARFRLALDYVTGGHYQRVSFRNWSATQQQAVKQTGGLEPDPSFDKPPYILARNAFPADQPLMVLFERSECDTCSEWHKEVLSNAGIREVLEQFQVVQLDMNDAETKMVKPNGKPTTPSLWAEELGLSYAPSIILYDEHGKLRQLIDFPVLHQRFKRSLLYMTEKAYMRGITYQRFTREKTAERLQREVEQSSH